MDIHTFFQLTNPGMRKMSISIQKLGKKELVKNEFENKNKDLKC